MGHCRLAPAAVQPRVTTPPQWLPASRVPLPRAWEALCVFLMYALSAHSLFLPPSLSLLYLSSLIIYYSEFLLI